MLDTKEAGKANINVLCSVEAVGLACKGAPKRARSIHLRAFILSVPSIHRRFPRSPHSCLPLCSGIISVRKFNVTSIPQTHPPALLPSLDPPLLWLLRLFICLLAVSSVRAESTGLRSRLLSSNSSPCVWGEAGCFFSF